MLGAPSGRHGIVLCLPFFVCVGNFYAQQRGSFSFFHAHLGKPSLFHILCCEQTLTSPEYGFRCEFCKTTHHLVVHATISSPAEQYSNLDKLTSRSQHSDMIVRCNQHGITSFNVKGWSPKHIAAIEAQFKIYFVAILDTWGCCDHTQCYSFVRQEIFHNTTGFLTFVCYGSFSQITSIAVLIPYGILLLQAVFTNGFKHIVTWVYCAVVSKSMNQILCVREKSQISTTFGAGHMTPTNHFTVQTRRGIFFPTQIKQTVCEACSGKPTKHLARDIAEQYQPSLLDV